MHSSSDLEVATAQVFKQTSKMPSASTFQLYIHSARLKSSVPMDYKYQSYLGQSVKNIVVVNHRPGGKFYKHNVDASEEEYQTVIKNCEKIQENYLKSIEKEGTKEKGKDKQPSKIIDDKEVKSVAEKMREKYQLDLKCGDQKFMFEDGKEDWALTFKKRLIKRKIDFIVDRKQMRLDMAERCSIITQADEKLIQNRDQLAKLIKIMRFKHVKVYALDALTSIHAGFIYESEEPNDFSDLRKALLSEEEFAMSQFIKQKIQRSWKNRAKKPLSTFRFEIKLKFTAKGNLKIMKMDEKNLREYLRKTLFSFQNLLTQNLQEKSLQKMLNDLKI